jgi:tetratricopeptide (TPR) repeat protein
MRSATELINPYDQSEYQQVYQRAQQIEVERRKRQQELEEQAAARANQRGPQGGGLTMPIGYEEAMMMQQQQQAGSSSSASGQDGSLNTSGVVPSEESMKQAIMEKREQAYQLSSQQAAARRAFEAAVAKRTWYHVKPLDPIILNGWRQYLAFEEAQGLPNAWRTEKVYGRCLVACANYSEFWLRYAAWKREITRLQAKLMGAAATATPAGETNNSSIEAQAALAGATALQQACDVFLPRRIDCHLYLACLYEAAGQRDKASGVYQRLLGLLPGEGGVGWASESAEVNTRYAHFLLRGGDINGAMEVLQKAVTIAGIKSDPQALAGVFAALTALTKEQNPLFPAASAPSTDAIKALRAAHEQAVSACPSEASAWLRFAEFEGSFKEDGATEKSDEDEQQTRRVRRVYRRALGLSDDTSAPAAASSTSVSDEGKALLFSSYISFMDSTGTNSSLLLEALDSAYEWERKRVLAGGGLDGIGVLATTAIAAARYAAVPHGLKDHAGAAAASNGGIPVVGQKRSASAAGLGTAVEAANVAQQQPQPQPSPMAAAGAPLQPQQHLMMPATMMMQPQMMQAGAAALPVGLPQAAAATGGGVAAAMMAQHYQQQHQVQQVHHQQPFYR